jgi:acetylornithine deacetylase/succinyl-diaminopimelate desuccinylase-like protein
MVTTEINKKISNVDEKDVVQLAVEWGNITAPAGYEQPVADYVENWFRAQGFHAFQQILCENRSNTIGIFKGAGGGRTLVFNSHMDSDQVRPRVHGERIPPGPKVRIEEPHLWQDRAK